MLYHTKIDVDVVAKFLVRSQKNHNNAAIMKNSEWNAKSYTPAARAPRYSNAKMQIERRKPGTRNTEHGE